MTSKDLYDIRKWFRDVIPENERKKEYRMMTNLMESETRIALLAELGEKIAEEGRTEVTENDIKKLILDCASYDAPLTRDEVDEIISTVGF